MVDDATSQVWAQFFEAETTRASYYVLEGWVRRRGLPQSLYADRDSIYRCEGVGSVAEQMAGQGPLTQIGRAMEQLGVGGRSRRNSPQAKGRADADQLRLAARPVGQGAAVGGDRATWGGPTSIWPRRSCRR